MTQSQTIFQMLEQGEWRCGTEFLQAFIPEYRSRINELRAKYQIVARRCENPRHIHKGGMQEWKLIEPAIRFSAPSPSKPILPSTKAFLEKWSKKKENVLW